MTGSGEIEARLRAYGAGGRLDLAEGALLLGALDAPEIDLQPYRDHLDRLVTDLAAEIGGLAAGRAGCEEAVAALNQVILRQHGYAGDREAYDDPANANLIGVVDRRRGLPVALAILYLHAGRAAGWQVEGIDFPGHFLVRVAVDGDRRMIDPFHGGHPLDAAALRRLLKRSVGPRAELAPDHYQPAGDRDILIRLQGNIKMRDLRRGDLAHALEVARRMIWIAPGRLELWHEIGAINMRLGDIEAAIAAFERYLAGARDPAARRRTEALLAELRNRDR